MNQITYILCLFALIGASNTVAQDKNDSRKCANFNLIECAKCCKELYKNHPRREAKIRECMEVNCPEMNQPFIGETTAFE